MCIRDSPWTHLLREKKTLPRDLNLQMGARMSAAALFLFLLQLSYSFYPLRRPTFRQLFSLVPLPLLLVILNYHFYRFLWQKRGTRFLLCAIPLHWFYYLYSSLVFVGISLKPAG